MANWDISTIFGVSDLDEKMYTDQQREGGEEGRKGSKGYLKKHTENPLVCLRKLQEAAEEQRVGCGAQGQMVPNVSVQRPL